jgi:hypothetical protein
MVKILYRSWEKHHAKSAISSALFARAGNIEHYLAIKHCLTCGFVSGVEKVADVVFCGQKSVQKIYEQVFMRFLTEEFFEAKIGEGVDVAGFHGGSFLR